MDIILNSSSVESDRKELAGELVRFLARAQEDALELLFDDVVAKHLAAAADRLESRYGLNGAPGFTRSGHGSPLAEQLLARSIDTRPDVGEREGDTALMLERMLVATQEIARRVAAIESEIKTVDAKLRAA